MKLRLCPIALSLGLLLSSCVAHPFTQEYLSKDSEGVNYAMLLALGLILADQPFTVQSLNVGGEPRAIVCGSQFVYLGGWDDSSGSRQWRVEKRSRYSGELDFGFGANGIINVDVDPAGNDEIQDMSFDGTYLYIAGYDNAPGSLQWRIEKRFASDGTLDTNFATSGILQHDPVPGAPDYLHALELASGGIYLGGSSSTGGAGQQWRIEKRLLSTGSLDTGFNGSGILTVSAGGGTQSRIFALAVDDTYIYAAGANQPGGDLEWRLDKRFLSDGSLESAFSSGTITDNAGSGAEDANVVVYDDTGVYITGSDPDQHIQVNKYDRNTGIGVTAFASPNGELVVDPSGGLDRLTTLLPLAGRIYFIGFDSANGSNYQWRIALRDASSGALVNEFGNNGVVQSDPTTENDIATVACTSGSFIFIAGYEGNTNRSWRIEKRRLSDGSQ